MRELITPKRVYVFKICCGLFSIAFVVLVMSPDITALYEAGVPTQDE